MRQKYLTVTVFIISIMLWYCENPNENTPPSISSLTANPSSVETDQSSALTCNASDSDGDSLTYVWESTTGSISGSGSSVTWNAPSSAGTYSVTCRVLDGNGGEDTESVNVTVTEASSSGGLIAHYPFNGNSNDESGNGHHGVVNGANLTVDRFGSSNRAYSFDGSNDKIALPFGVEEIVSSYTINIWFYKTKSITGHPMMGVISSDKGSDRGMGIGIPAYNKVKFHVYNMANEQVEVADAAILTDSEWYMATFTYSGSIVKWYVNGVLSGEQSFSDNLRGSEKFYIGWHPYDTYLTERYFGGKIDDVSIYDNALSQNEIISLYTEGGWTGGTSNTPPTISSLTANPSSVETGQSSTLTCSASDSDGDNLSYVWEPSTGSISGSGSSVTWNAPSSAGTYSVTCRVSDGNGGEDTESVNVTVTEASGGDITPPMVTFDRRAMRHDGPADHILLVESSNIFGSVPPGATVNAEINWQFPVSENTSAIYKGKAFGDWDHNNALAVIHDGSTPSLGQTQNESFSFTAPTEPGIYVVRMILNASYSHPSNYTDFTHYKYDFVFSVEGHSETTLIDYLYYSGRNDGARSSQNGGAHVISVTANNIAGYTFTGGQTVNTDISWLVPFDENYSAIYKANVFGNWDQDQEIAQIHSGGTPSQMSGQNESFSFTAPSASGWYSLRLIWNASYSFAGSFTGDTHYFTDLVFYVQ